MLAHRQIAVVAPALLVALLLAPAALGANLDEMAPLSMRSSASDVAALTGAAAIGQAETGSTHPAWVTDIESKTWKGFMTGMTGHENFVKPVGMPVYFEDPFITTDMRILYVFHEIPDESVLRGGDVHLLAAQIRLALTDRLGLIVVKGGYSWFDSNITEEGDGWNDWGLGLKYLVYANPEDEMFLSAGLRWEATNGSAGAMQGNDSQELSPFISFAKGWGKWHMLGHLGYRYACDDGAGNDSVIWNLHFDYELKDNFRPLIELHGIHWTSNGDRLPLDTDYLDVGSLGVANAAGRDFFSLGLGFRWEIIENVNFGTTFELPLESADDHLQDFRLTFNTVISF